MLLQESCVESKVDPINLHETSPQQASYSWASIVDERVDLQTKNTINLLNFLQQHLFFSFSLWLTWDHYSCFIGKGSSAFISSLSCSPNILVLNQIVVFISQLKPLKLKPVFVCLVWFFNLVRLFFSIWSIFVYFLSPFAVRFVIMRFLLFLLLWWMLGMFLYVQRMKYLFCLLLIALFLINCFVSCQSPVSILLVGFTDTSSKYSYF